MLLVDVVLRSNLFPLQHLVQRRGTILDALFHMSKGFYFVPHHQIMASLVHFEEKVHRKKLQRADTIPLLFPRLLCQILEHIGFSTEPQHERRRICRERFTLDKWNLLAGYFAPPRAHLMVALPEPPQIEQAQSTPIPIEQGELLTETIPLAAASPTLAQLVPMPEAIFAAPPMTHTVPPVAPTTSEPSITVSASEFHVLVATLQTLSTTHAALFQQMAEMSFQQNQQIAILHQILQHLGLLPPPQPDLPASSEPLAPVEGTILAKDTTTAEVQIVPPQEATTNAIALIDPQDEPQTVNIVTTTLEDASSPPEAPTT